MSNKERIKELYFNCKYNQTEIAKELNVSTKYVSKVLLLDSRYIKEKTRRQNENRAKNKKETINYITNQRKLIARDVTYEIMKNQHEQASRELSGGRKPIGNRAYRDWNTSIYKFNEKTKSYVLKKGINVGADVPKRIKWNLN
ncbi:MAG: hypothetical protein J6D03_11380 [Clostridia bacterium]|nr:hypothetical protein [Clostridia bacterium]